MAFRSGRVPTPVVITSDGGLNTSVDASEIAENQLSTAFNVDYEPTTLRLQTREGIQISNVQKLDGPITFLYSFVRSVSESWIMAVSDLVLYKLDFSGGRLLTVDGELLVDAEGNILTVNGETPHEWTKVADIESNIPTMTTFNGKLIIADGSADGLLSWDGTTLTRITGSPAKAIAVYSMQGRVICSADERANYDAVYMSKTNDETGWDTAAGAVILRAGYGDGLQVNGFSTVSDLLLVSKIARNGGVVSKKAFYGVQMRGDTSTWYARSISNLNSAVSPHALVQLGSDVLYMDSEGFATLAPTERFGDITTDPLIGVRVNKNVSPIARSYENVQMINIPDKSEILTIFSSTGKPTKVWHFSKVKKMFTKIEYFISNPEVSILTAVQHGDEVFYAGNNGYLYQSTPSGYDEPLPETFTDIGSVVRFKNFTGSGDLLLTKSFVQASYLNSGTYTYEIYKGSLEDKKILGTFDFFVGDSERELYNATEDLADATYQLGGLRSEVKNIRSKVRGSGIQAQVRTKNGGRISISNIKQFLALVGN